MASTDTTETVATYEAEGARYEIDHLGILYPQTQWGEFAVYCEGYHVASFLTDYMDLPDTDELIRLAKRATSEADR
jgi:hypothetical protein